MRALPRIKLHIGTHATGYVRRGLRDWTVARDSEKFVQRRKPGAMRHLAFKAESRHEVDGLFIRLEENGANILNEPEIFREYGPERLCHFFKDIERYRGNQILNCLQ